MGATMTTCCKDEDIDNQDIHGCGPTRIMDECTPMVFDQLVQRGSQQLSEQQCKDVLLVQSVKRGDLQDAKRALSLGANIDNTESLRLCLTYYPPDDAVDDVTPLMSACELGFGELITFLIEHKADPTKKDSRGWNPLCYALSGGELSVVQQLLQEVGPLREKIVSSAKPYLDDVTDSDARSMIEDELLNGPQSKKKPQINHPDDLIGRWDPKAV